jgi:hypothetical protein
MILLMNLGLLTSTRISLYSISKLSLILNIYSLFSRECIRPLELMMMRKLFSLSLLNSLILSHSSEVWYLNWLSSRPQVALLTPIENLSMITPTAAKLPQICATQGNLLLKRKISAKLSMLKRQVLDLKMLKD